MQGKTDSVKQLTKFERNEAEEIEPLDLLRDAVSPAEDSENEESRDDMFCTAAGAVSFKPSAGRSKLREMLNKADRA